MRTFLALSWLVASFLALASMAFAAESDVDRLLDLLTEKGVISKEDAAAFRADLAIKKQEEKQEQKEFTVIAGNPIKISGYTQLRYQALEEKDKVDSFDIRRARLDIKGDITEKIDYRLQADFAGSSAKLLDATMAYKISPQLKLSAGQFKIPFSQENLISSPKLETINRSQVVEALVARGKDVIGNQNGRDIGIQAGGSFCLRDDRYLFDYALAVVNGSGINTSDKNEEKDLAARIVFHPLKGFDIGGSFYNGVGNFGKPSANQNRDRIGAEFAYQYESLSLKGEYIAGEDGDIKKDGWYVQTGYFFLPKTVQGVVKFDTFDPDTESGKDETDVITFGVNWFFNKWAFLQVNYEMRNEHGEDVNNDAVIAQLTLQF